MLAVPLTDYYEEVRRYLTCPEEVKDDLIYDVNRKVMDLNADRPDLDYNGTRGSRRLGQLLDGTDV